MVDHLLQRAALCFGALLLAAPRAQGQTPASLTLAVPTTVCAQDVTGQVTLTAPAPAAGLTVQLSSSMPAVVSVPASLAVPAGATSAAVRLARCTPTTQSVAVVISATVNGGTQSATLNVLAPALRAITLKPESSSPARFTGAAVLLGPAPAGGTIVTLANSQPTLVTIPSSVTIPGGALSANFSAVAIAPVSQPTPFTITGSALGETVATTTTLPTAVPVSLLLSSGTNTAASGAASGLVASLTVPSGGSVLAQLTLNGPAGRGGLSVKLASSNVAVATVPTAFVMPEGDSIARFTVNTVGQSQNQSVEIRANVGATSTSATLTVTGTTLASLGVLPNPVIAGLTTQGLVTASRTAGPGGLSVRLSSGNIDLVRVPAIVTIQEGASSASFPITTMFTDAPRAVTISAVGGGTTQSATVTLTPEGLSAFSITPTRVMGGSTVTGRLSAPFGHNGFSVRLVSASPEVAVAPGTIMFTAQDTSKTFTITANPVRVATTARITATVTTATVMTASVTPATLSSVSGLSNLGAVSISRTAEFSVAPPTVKSITLSKDRVIGGAVVAFTGTVTLTAPAPAGLGIVLAATDPVVGVPSAVIVEAGAMTATFAIRTLTVTADTDVSVRATTESDTFGKTATVRVIVRP